MFKTNQKKAYHIYMYSCPQQQPEEHRVFDGHLLHLCLFLQHLQIEKGSGNNVAKILTVLFINETSSSTFNIDSTRLALSSLSKCFIFTSTEVCPSIVQRVFMSGLQPKLSSAYLLIWGRIHFKVRSMRKGCSHTKANSSSTLG